MFLINQFAEHHSLTQGSSFYLRLKRSLGTNLSIRQASEQLVTSL
jgi:hypothetical protein